MDDFTKEKIRELAKGLIGQPRFTCDNCRRTFVKGRSDEEAMMETTEMFGEGFSEEDCAVFCDDCYKIIQNWDIRYECSTCGATYGSDLVCPRCQIKRNLCVVCSVPTRGVLTEDEDDVEIDILNICPKCFKNKELTTEQARNLIIR